MIAFTDHPTSVFNELKVNPRKRSITKCLLLVETLDPSSIRFNDDEANVGEDHGGNYAHVMGMLRDDYTARGKRKSNERRRGEVERRR